MYCTLNPVTVTINPNVLTTEEQNYSEWIRQFVRNNTGLYFRKTYIKTYIMMEEIHVLQFNCLSRLLFFIQMHRVILRIFELWRELCPVSRTLSSQLCSMLLRIKMIRNRRTTGMTTICRTMSDHVGLVCVKAVVPRPTLQPNCSTFLIEMKTTFGINR